MSNDAAESRPVRGPVHIAQKGWGHEVWIHNDERYCGKILVVKEGKRCSKHFHKLKYETFYIQKGRVAMWLQHPDGREQTFEMAQGEVMELSQGTVHQFTALEDTEIMEFSTQHFDSDSHRIEPGD